jgi:hypothetical protein
VDIHSDPIALVETLSSVEIARRIDVLDAQVRALRTLWRAARQRERAADRDCRNRQRKEPPHG